MEGALAGVGELCGGDDHLLSPLKQSPDADCLRAHMVESWLHDGQVDLPDVIQHPVGGIGAQSIEPQLRVAGRLDFDSLAVLKIDDLHVVVADDNDVAGAEALRNPLTKIQPLLKHDQGVRCTLSISCNSLHNECYVISNMVLHRFAVIR